MAYVIWRCCGLDTGGSAFYLAARESDDFGAVRERLERISTSALEIIDILDN